MSTEHPTTARFTRKIVIWEEPKVVELIAEWADEGACSQSAIVRHALRAYFGDRLKPNETRVG
jgi:hypothetical protein